jgi:hypothetical protein
LAAGPTDAFGAPEIEAAMRFCELHASHAETEETLVFPAATLLFGENDLRAMGEEMAARRGARRPAGS